ncbi:hypothetical protein ACHAL6_01150 [Proteiniclasticum sp. C24MP]|uniref:hypothetical protein n=1 Tax=Proteiniclasticum sp. C24MP TaxID=3374101 RepID=UPI003754F82B
MKTNTKIWIWILVLALLAVWAVPKMPFNEEIVRKIEAQVYVEGVPVRTTEVVIEGERSRYLFSDRQMFFGDFQMEEYPRTQREDMMAEISWHERFDVEQIIYAQNATFPDLEMERDLIMDEAMEHFALGFKDGRIVATSSELMEEYRERYSKED